MLTAFIEQIKNQVEKNELETLKKPLQCNITTNTGIVYEFVGRIHKASNADEAIMQDHTGKDTTQLHTTEYPWYEVRILAMDPVLSTATRIRNNTPISVILPIVGTTRGKRIIGTPNVITSLDQAIHMWESWCLLCCYSMIDSIHIDYQSLFEKMLVDFDTRNKIIMESTIALIDFV